MCRQIYFFFYINSLIVQLHFITIKYSIKLYIAIHDNLVCYTDTKPTNMGIQSPGHVCTMLNLNCKSKETGMCSVFTL